MFIITALNSALTKQTSDGSFYHIAKYGKVVTVEISGTLATSAANNATTLEFTLESKYRPRQDVYAVISFGGTSNTIGLLQVKTDGKVSIMQKTGAACGYAYGSVTYITD